ncbi:MAG: beta-N-acetylhexosaminidase [Dokdonella sp.]|uniref:beta-N-acetylhexosaminidase n=2 Tax=Dokdonella sp. TaxID=2291710 RepID=UPI002CA5CBF0|nr:beta-N-acetylhexosaminidase [Xanthomonadales bacterium]HQV72251.1 beta-N-acetylhexosaminidase [Dokdonella sp.]MBK7208774.1 beta-N-acetylhexosaminidase [Xanthomonadales bacterium]MBL0221807.1 beta-N-acetylhexosaminidase [Xanthomonadales bacterium]HQW75524.1 beta-N-acetylhexosaminidase [Dokdonella sp.]
MLIIGIPGKTLNDEDRVWLSSPQVSGVILFSRNCANRDQVVELIDDIRMERPDDPFLICVDQEGGPVQRFREGFSRLPALARLGELYERDARLAVALAEEHAWLMASEMRAIDIDLSFAPVADLACGNLALGPRAFHADPAITSELVQAYARGMHLAGMAVTLKHFPGHGSVVADTHFDAAIDPRTLAEMRRSDFIPFIDGIAAGAEAVMIAHVNYPEIDATAAGFSSIWIGDILRKEMGFNGIVIGDDIGMAAAEAMGGIPARIEAHLRAGCELILACSPAIVEQSVTATAHLPACPAARVESLRGAAAPTWEALEDNPKRDEAISRLAEFCPDPSSK